MQTLLDRAGRDILKFGRVSDATLSAIRAYDRRHGMWPVTATEDMLRRYKLVTGANPSSFTPR